MTRQDTYKMWAVLQAFYPDSFRGMTDDATKMKVSLWHEAFADDPGPLVIAAAKAYASTDTKGFLPTPGQIKEQMRLLQKRNCELTEQEAWSLVLKALGNSTYGYVEEFEKLPEVIQRAVGSHNVLRQWGMYDVGDLQYTASDFKRAYREIISQRRNLEKIPASVKMIADNQPDMLEASTQFT